VDWVILNGGIGRRRLMGGGFFFGSAVLLACSLMSADPWQATAFASLSCFATQATQPLWWSCSTGISGRHVGALLGLMNSVGVFGALSSQFLVGLIATWLGKQGFTGRDQWDPIFFINIGVLLFACLLWSTFRFRTVEPVPESSLPEQPDEAHAHD
jgi:MFS family permease